VPVNVIDRPAHCDFAFGAIVNRSPLSRFDLTGQRMPAVIPSLR
jgi:siroheme synthase (precorrin-2 oxidase/ferrochelatase)